MAAFVAARAIIPMGMTMPPEFSEMSICGAHGIETILVDQNMNVAGPDRRGPGGGADIAGHCGACIFVLALVWSVSLIMSLMLFVPAIAGWHAENWRQLVFAFSLARPRAPPLAA
ncbi:MAG: DUF2946 family protein [Alphaproteobacteria bacterium]